MLSKGSTWILQYAVFPGLLSLMLTESFLSLSHTFYVAISDVASKMPVLRGCRGMVEHQVTKAPSLSAVKGFDK